MKKREGGKVGIPESRKNKRRMFTYLQKAKQDISLCLKDTTGGKAGGGEPPLRANYEYEIGHNVEL